MVVADGEVFGSKKALQIEQRHAPKTISITENSPSAMLSSQSISPAPIPIPSESAPPLSVTADEAAPLEEDGLGQGQGLGNATTTTRSSTASPPAGALLDSGHAASSTDLYSASQSSMPRNFRLSLDGERSVSGRKSRLS